ncbi:MAG: hypothetical protein RI963_2966 [Planctomycetota bacterium]|jgi:hypothetical protein
MSRSKVLTVQARFATFPTTSPEPFAISSLSIAFSYRLSLTHYRNHLTVTASIGHNLPP